MAKKKYKTLESIHDIAGKAKLYAKMEAVDKLSSAITYAIIILLVIIVGSAAMFCLCFGISFYVGKAIGSMPLGFILTGLAFLAIIIATYLLRRQIIENTLVTILSDKILNPKVEENAAEEGSDSTGNESTAGNASEGATANTQKADVNEGSAANETTSTANEGAASGTFSTEPAAADSMGGSCQQPGTSRSNNEIDEIPNLDEYGK